MATVSDLKNKNSDPVAERNSWERAYPKDLRKKEEELLRRAPERRASSDARHKRPISVGLALSGGGIRSATFSFGVIQALARHKMLGQIDVLSTVSGGGYTGGLLTRLFAQENVKDHEDVRRSILADHKTAAGQPDASAGQPDASAEQPDASANESDAFAGQSDASAGESDALADESSSKSPTIQTGGVLRWIRDNGRYLAPNGGGDLLLNCSVLLRNWLSVHIVLITLVLPLFVFMQALRAWTHERFLAEGEVWPSACGGEVGGSFAFLEAWLTCNLPFGGTHLWWSPWMLGPAGVVALVVVPVGWVYWLAADYPKHRLASWIGLFPPVLVVSYLAYEFKLVGTTALVFVLSAWIMTLTLFFGWAWFGSKPTNPSDVQDRKLRNDLSSLLKAVLILSGALLILALVDTLGQTIYVMSLAPNSNLSAWFTSGFGALIAVFAAIRWVARYVSDSTGNARIRPSLRMVAWGAAVLLLATWLVTVNVLAHGVAWHFQFPMRVPMELVESFPSDAKSFAQISSLGHAQSTFHCVDCIKVGKPDFWGTLSVAFVLALMSLLLGHLWPFLNNSTLLPLYTARLTRAYLGASNPTRLDPRAPESVTRVLAKDDLCFDWRQTESTNGGTADPFKKGAPLHIINVTINETLEDKLQLQQMDRKGIGMAVGPAGISAGVRHHVIFSQDTSGDTVLPAEGDGYRMFDYKQSNGGQTANKPQALSIGQWIGISGAAFSTGLGSRTSSALSIIAGLFNLRLGYWWDSGVDPDSRDVPTKRLGCFAWCGRQFTRAFPVQSYLIDEILGRFHGPGRRHWCLSDGGHFDNTGAYELIRRRVPLMVLIDSEADPDYVFEGIGNLVRKARIDFNAEIEFLDGPEIEDLVEGSEITNLNGLPYVGTLEMLRRPKWVKGRSKREDSTEQGESEAEGCRKSPPQSTAHSAIARVRYKDCAEKCSFLVYIKPTLVGTEPVDISHYHSANPDFPHQATTDQFFDEAQWESYRKLGELITERVLSKANFEFFQAQVKPKEQS